MSPVGRERGAASVGPRAWGWPPLPWAALSSVLAPAGKLCQWTDACLSQPCANGSTCTTAANQFSCRCLAGFTGQKCEADVNECDAPGQCQHGGTCVNLPGSYQCQCPQGFTGQHCESPYVPCAPSPCVNGGTCRPTGDFTFECNCLPGEELPACPGVGRRSPPPHRRTRVGAALWEKPPSQWRERGSVSFVSGEGRVSGPAVVRTRAEG